MIKKLKIISVAMVLKEIDECVAVSLEKADVNVLIVRKLL